MVEILTALVLLALVAMIVFGCMDYNDNEI